LGAAGGHRGGLAPGCLALLHSLFVNMPCASRLPFPTAACQNVGRTPGSSLDEEALDAAPPFAADRRPARPRRLRREQLGLGRRRQPGEDCLGCHREFTAAGTVYGADASQGLAGVTVRIDGTRQQNVTLTTNSAGNFYTTVDFGYGPGATVTVQGASGQSPYELTNRSFAACNSCHPAGRRIHVP